MNDGCVVELGWPEFSGTRGIGTIQGGAQTAAVGILHDRHVGGHEQGEFPAGFAVLLRGLARRLADVVGQPGQFGLVGNDFGKGIGRIEQVLRELGGETRQFFGNGLKARFLLLGQFGAGKAEIAHLVVDNLALRLRECRVVLARADSLVFGKEFQVLSELGKKSRDFGQHAVVGLTPLRNIVDRVQVADNPPGTGESFYAVGERRGKVVPAGGNGSGRQFFDQFAVFLQQL